MKYCIYCGAKLPKNYTTNTYPPPPPPPAPKDIIIEANEKEATKVIEKETLKEIIVKVRCSYCHQLYDEYLDACPNCGGKK